MRKGLILIVFSISSLIGKGAQAQSANMSITLLDALSFTVNEPFFLANSSSDDKNDNQIRAIASDHICVVSSKGYVVKAMYGERSGSGPGIDGLVEVSSLIGTTNKGNTVGLVLKSNVVLPPANGSAVTVIAASNTSWNGQYAANKFNIAYKIGNKYAYIDKNAAPSIIPVIFSVIQP